MTEQQATFYGKMFQDLNLTELEVEEDGTKLCLKKKAETCQSTSNEVAAYANHVEGAVQSSDIALDHTASGQQGAGTPIKAPLLGIFHRAPSPNEPPFVEEGDTVKKGDVLCVIEAMKMMNEITAGRDGVIVTVCAEENSIVEYGQVIFEII